MEFIFTNLFYIATDEEKQIFVKEPYYTIGYPSDSKDYFPISLTNF